MISRVVCKRCSVSFRTTHYGLLFTFGATRAYETLFSITGINHVDRADMITLEMFTMGFYIPGFDLTPDREADEEHISMPRQGNVCIEALLNKPLPEPVACILYAELPEHVEIDNAINVTVELIPLRSIKFCLNM